MNYKSFVIAYLPSPEIRQAFIQYIRDFDVAHPECHFEIAAEGEDLSKLSLHDAIDKIQVEPELTFTKVFDRQLKK